VLKHFYCCQFSKSLYFIAYFWNRSVSKQFAM